MQVRRESTDIGIFLLKPRARREWMVHAMPRPLYPAEEAPVHIVQRAGWAPRAVWTGVRKKTSLTPLRFELRTFQTIDSRYAGDATPSSLMLHALTSHNPCTQGRASPC